MSKATTRALASVTIAAFVAQLAPVWMQPAAAAEPVNLNLKSTQRTEAASLPGGAVHIRVGGGYRTINDGMMLTPAEMLAVSQVLASGRQAILLGTLGNAIGGKFTINPTLGSNISNLVIPARVTSFDVASSVNVLSNITNFGNLRAVFGPYGATTASVFADNIYNKRGASITSSLPLSLFATGDVINSGRIVSASSLAISAGDSIVNALPTGARGRLPATITAANDLTLFSTNITNSGVMSSLNGNINLASQSAANLQFNNAGGKLSATNGDINVRNESFAGKYNFNLLGGDVLAKNMNVWSGDGTVNIDTKKLTPVVNITAGIAHVTARTKNLQLGAMNLSGDPTYYNLSGDITISGAINTDGNDLAIIASGNVLTATGGSGGINTDNLNPPTGTFDGGPAGDVMIIAGANFTVQPAATGAFNNPNGTTTGSQNGGTGDNGSLITVTGASATGGKIDFSLQPMTIEARGTGNSTVPTSGPGGNVTLIAFAGTGTSSTPTTTDTGTINMGTTGQIFTAGYSLPANTNANGNVTMIAGATSNSSSTNAAIVTGNIDTMTVESVKSSGGSSSPGQGGFILLTTAQPVITNPFTILQGQVPANGTSYGSGAWPTTSSPTITTASPLEGFLQPGQQIQISGNITGGAVASEVATVSSVVTGPPPGTGQPQTYIITLDSVANDYIATVSYAPDPSPTVTTGKVQPTTINLNGTLLTNAAPIEAVAGQHINIGGTITTNGVLPQSAVSPGGILALYAGGNITTINGASTINTSGTTAASGGDVTMVAGARTSVALTSVFSLAPQALTMAVNVLGPTAAGGNIDLTGGGLANLTTLSTTGATPAVTDPNGYKGGDVNLIAFSGASGGTSTGTVTTPSALTILTGGSTPSFPTRTVTNIASLVIDVADISGYSIGDTLSLQGQTSSGFAQESVVVSAVTPSPTPPPSPSVSVLHIANTYTTGISLYFPGTNDNRNGDVKILAGAGTGTGINVGNINTTGSNAGGGNITIHTTQPAGGYSTSISNSSGGVAVTGSLASNGKTQPASATVGTLQAAGASVAYPNYVGNPTATTSVYVQAGKDLTIGSISNTNGALPDGSASGFPGGGTSSSRIDVIAGGTMTFSGSPTIDASANGAPVQASPAIEGVLGVNGGTISLKAATFSGAATVSANGYDGSSASGYDPVGGTGGNGGDITIESTGTSSTLTVGASNLQVSAQAGSTGGNGGTVVLKSAQNINVTDGTQINVGAQAGNAYNLPPTNVVPSTGNGGNISLLAEKGTVFVTGNLNADGAQSYLNTATGGTMAGDGGTINIVVNSPSAVPFAIGSPAGTTPNGLTGSLQARGNQVNGSSLSAVGSGGTISVTNLGAGGITFASGTIDVSAASALDPQTGSLTTSFPAGNGGHISLTSAAAGGTVSGAGNLSADGGSSSTTRASGDGGSIQIVTNSTSSFQVNNGSATNGVAGTVTASGNVGATPTTAGPLFMFFPQGNGGSVSITNKGTGGITIAASGLSVAAMPADAQVAGAYYPGHNSGGNGGSISLSAPSGPVLSLGPLDASGGAPNGAAGVLQNDGGTGGTITILSNSSNQFMIGTGTSAPTNVTPGQGNGVVGTLTAEGYSGGTISVTNNNASGIQVGLASSALAISVATVLPAGPDSNSQSPTGGAGGTVALQAPKGPVLLLAALDVSGSSGATTYQSGGDGGSILIVSSGSLFGINGTAAQVGTNGVIGTLTANGGSGIAAGGNGGQVTIVNSGAGIQIFADSSIAVAGGPASQSSSAGAGGAISLQATKGQVIIEGSLHADGGAQYITGTDPYNGLARTLTNGNMPSTTSYAAGNGGSIYILTSSTNVFQAGGASGTVNGFSGTLSATGWSGGSITIINKTGGINVGSGAIDVSAGDAIGTAFFKTEEKFQGGPGGNISLQAPKSTVVIDGDLAANGGNFGTTSNTISDYFPGGNGGQISIITNSTQPFDIGGTGSGNNGTNGTLSASGVNGGSISIINLGSGGIKVAADTISVQAIAGDTTYPTTNYADQTTNPAPQYIYFRGSGYGGNGGHIYLGALGTSAEVFVAADTNGNSLIADGGVGADGDGVTTAYGTAGNGGSISIVSNSTVQFNLGAAVAGSNANGTAGILTASGYNGGSVGVKNYGTGGIGIQPTSLLVSAAMGASAQLTDPAGGNGGQIDLSAPNGTIIATVAGTLSADAATMTNQTGASGGIIVVKGKTVVGASSQALTLSAQGDPTTSALGVGGTVIINQTSGLAANVLSIGRNALLNARVNGSPGSTDGTIAISAPAGVLLNGKLTTGDNTGTGKISIIINGAGSLNGSSITSSIYTGALNVSTTTGSIGSTNPLNTQISSLLFTTTSGSALITNNSSIDVEMSATSSKSALGVTLSAGDISTSGLGIVTPGSVSLTTGNGNININANINAGSISLSADGSSTSGGGIYGNSGVISAPSISLTAGADGIQSLQTATGAVNLNVAGNATGSTLVAIINTGNLSVNYGNSTAVDSLSIIASGSITTTGAITTANNIALDNSDNNTNSSIIIGGLLGNGQSNGVVSITAAGDIVQTSSSNVIQANQITLTSQNGNIGVPTRTLGTGNIYQPGGTAIAVNLIPNGGAGQLTVATVNEHNGFGAGTIYVNNSNAGGMEIMSANAGSDLVLTSASDITVTGPVVSNFGAVMIWNTDQSTGVMSINANVSALGGPLVIENDNTAGAGAILTVAQNVALTGNAWVLDTNSVNAATGVALLAGTGTFPVPPVGGSQPTNVPSISGSGTVNYGTNSITANGTWTVNLNPNAGSNTNVTFNGNAGDAITLDTGVVINATSNIQAISSLTAATLAADAGQPGITNTGTAANPVYQISSSVSLSNLSALNLPGNVTVQLVNFQASNPVVVNTQTGTANATITGDLQFVNASSSGNVLVTSNVPGTVLSVKAGGTLTSAGDIVIAANGSMKVDGQVSAGASNFLALYTGAANLPTTSGPKVANAGTITINGTVGAGEIVDGGTIDINAGGSILLQNGAIEAQTIGLHVGGYNSGFAPSAITVTNAAAENLSFIAGSGSTISAKSGFLVVGAFDLNTLNSNVTINQNSPMQLSGTTFGTLNVKSKLGPITVAEGAALYCGTCTLQTPSLIYAGEIATNSVRGTITISAPGTSSLTLTGTDPSNSAISAAASINIKSGSGTVKLDGGSLSTTSGVVQILARKQITLVGTSLSAGQSDNYFLTGPLLPTNVSSSGAVNINSTTGAISSDAFITTVGGDISIAGKGNVTLHGTYEADGGNLLVSSTSGTVSGAGSFTANAVGTNVTNSTGGTINISSGSPIIQLFGDPSPSLALKQAPGTVPGQPAFIQSDQSIGSLGNDVSITNIADGAYPTGAIMFQSGDTKVNLGASGLTLMTLSGGMVVLNASGTNSSITFNDSVFSTSSYTPIGYASTAPQGNRDIDEEVVFVDVETDAAGI